MRPTLRPALALAAVTAGCAVLPAAAHAAASVAYVDDGEIWVAALDGSSRTKIGPQFTFTDSQGAPVTQKYNEVAMADGGRIVGIRIEPGKISNLSRFRVWEPNGQVARNTSGQELDGAVGNDGAGPFYVYPLALDITPDGGLFLNSFQKTTYVGGTITGQTYGYYAQPVTNTAGLQPVSVTGHKYATLYGKRAVTQSSDTQIALQKDVSGAPVSNNSDFDPFLGLQAPAGQELTRSELSSDGKVLAVARQQFNSGQQVVAAIDVLPISTFGPPATADFAMGCTIPAQGLADHVSISPDATRIAWHDDGGVKVAPMPTFTGADACQFSSPPVVVSPTGKAPSIGGADAAVISATLNPQPAPTPGPAPAPTPGPTPGATPTPGGGTGGTGGGSGTGGGTTSTTPTFTVPSAGIKASTLTGTKGLSFRVTARRAGRITVKLTVAPKVLRRKGSKAITIATGSATAKKAGAITVKLKRTSAAKGKAERLRKAKATITVTQAGKSAKKTVTLK